MSDTLPVGPALEGRAVRLQRPSGRTERVHVSQVHDLGEGYSVISGYLMGRADGPYAGDYRGRFTTTRYRLGDRVQVID